MRTVCPSCQSAYDVPESVLAARRTLRCARCATDFTAVEDGPAVAVAREVSRVSDEAVLGSVPSPANPAQPANPLAQKTPEPVGRRPGDAVYLATPPASARTLAQMPPAVKAGWIASFIILITMGWAFVAWRAPIMRAWPPSARFYALLRLA